MCLCTPLFNLSFQKYSGSFHKMVIPNGKNIITNHRNDYDRGLNAPFFLWQLAPGRVSRGELVFSERPDIVFTLKKRAYLGFKYLHLEQGHQGLPWRHTWSKISLASGVGIWPGSAPEGDRRANPGYSREIISFRAWESLDSWECLGTSLEHLEEVAEEREIKAPLFKLLSPTASKRMDAQ